MSTPLNDEVYYLLMDKLPEKLHLCSMDNSFVGGSVMSYTGGAFVGAVKRPVKILTLFMTSKWTRTNKLTTPISIKINLFHSRLHYCHS